MPALAARLHKLGAETVSPRVLERNLRFDTPSGELTRTFRVVRLRQDAQVRLTYKSPGKIAGGVRRREEIEFTVGDFAQAQAFLEALGYQVCFIYEKYRTTYYLAETEIVLDELPFGHFVEIEGPGGPAIQRAAVLLGLDWEARIAESYFALFQLAQIALRLPFRDLTFENFAALPVPPQALGVRPADEAAR